MSWLQLGTTEWEWAESSALGGAGWAYPVVTLLIGGVAAHLALYTTRRIGAASLVGLGVLLVQVVTLAFYWALLPPGPVLAAYLLLVPSAVALDSWYALRSSIRDPRPTWWAGALLYGWCSWRSPSCTSASSWP